MALLERMFKISGSGSSIRTEIIAGLTTFMAMAYVVAVNPLVLSSAGMDIGAVTVATCLAAGIASILMGLFANLPIGLAPGMGINAFFAISVCKKLGVPWEQALGVVFISGVLFLLLSISGAREKAIRGIPDSQKCAIAAGLGLFLAFMGFQNAGLITSDPDTFVTLASLHDPLVLRKITLLFAGLFVTVGLMAKKIPGGIIIGVLFATLLNRIPIMTIEGTEVLRSTNLGETFLKLDLVGALSWSLAPVILTFLVIDFFDTSGTLVGLFRRMGGGLRTPNLKRALSVDASSTIFGALVGTSTVTSYVESGSGIEEGGRTGLAAIVTGLLFILCIFLAPLVGLIPSPAVAPALIVVGLMMAEAFRGVDLDDITEGLPAFLTMILMPLTFSITKGIAIGFVSYPLIKILTGRGREVPASMYVLAGVFVLFFVISPIFD
jgi:AGZA family xanthine/uracil permease-like MFS transporter